MLGDGETVNAAMLQLSGGRARQHPAASRTWDHGDAETLRSALAEAEWNVSRTAAHLGISRNSLRYWMAKHGLRPGAPAPSARAHDVVRPELSHAASRSASTPARTLRWERRHVALLSAVLANDDQAVGSASAHRALETAVEKVEMFGGRVTEIGPARLLAAFGLDQGEDPVRRAAHAALGIVINATAIPSSGGPRDVPITVGVHAAEVTVGRFGETTEIEAADRRQADSLLDDLTRPAAAGTAIVTEAAASFLWRRFHLVADDRTGGGRCYRLVRYDVTFGGCSWMPRFVGRAVEIDHLQRMLGLAAGGSGQVVALVGEPGVGKSRLLWEFTRSAEVHGWRVLQTAAIPHGRTVPYLPVADLIRSLFEATGAGNRDPIPAAGAEMCRRLGLPLSASSLCSTCPSTNPGGVPSIHRAGATRRWRPPSGSCSRRAWSGRSSSPSRTFTGSTPRRSPCSPA